MSNGGYLQTGKGLEARKEEIRSVNEHYDEVIEHIMDPGRSEREQKEFESNPLFAAGIRALDRVKWDMMDAEQMAAQVQAHGL